MPWYEHAINTKAITSLFDNLPELNNVSIGQIELDRARVCLRICIDLDQFPDHPPAKWSGRQYNHAQVTLDFYEIDKLKITGWGGSNTAQINVKRENDRIHVEISGDECATEFTCFAFRVEGFSGYWDPGQNRSTGQTVRE